MQGRRAALVATVVALLCAACSGGDGVAGTWRLDRAEPPADAPEDAPILLVIGPVGEDRARVTVRADCDGFVGDGPTADGDWETTLFPQEPSLPCPDRQLGEALASLTRSITRVTRWERRGDRLVLTGPDTELHLTRASPDADRSPLAGPTTRPAG